jgi:HD-GYP domain-containing protein (c-di-GMP phosphodiesterase class II)
MGFRRKGRFLMSTLKLQYPVHDIDNRLLLSAGTELSEQVLDDLVASNHTTSLESLPLLDYGSVRKDIIRFLGQPPYQLIFPSKEDIDDVLKQMEKVRLVLPFLRSLDYFKRNDFTTYSHLLNVFALSTLLAGDLITDYHERIREAAAGPAHDFGKICVPLGILKKTSPLRRVEREILEHHTVAGYVLLSYYKKDSHSLAARVARDHHERRDGSGYPRGIHLDDRMVEIVAVSDMYDALVSLRPYRPISYDKRSALEEIVIQAEQNKVGWDVVKAIVAHSRTDKPYYKEVEIPLEKRGGPPPGNVYGMVAEETDPNDSNS